MRVLYLRALSFAAILTCVQCACEPPKSSCESELPSDRAALVDQVRSAAKTDQGIWDSYWACNSVDAGTAIDAIGQKRRADLVLRELHDDCDVSRLETTFTDPLRPPSCRVSRNDVCAALAVPPIQVSLPKRRELAQLLTECAHQGSWWTAEHLVSANQVDRVIQELRSEDHVTWSEISTTCKAVQKSCCLLEDEDCSPVVRNPQPARRCVAAWDWL